jgi:hypothetical protein
MMGVRLADTRLDAAERHEAGGGSVGYLRVAEGPLNAVSDRLIPTGGHVPIEHVSAQPLAYVVPAARSEERAAPDVRRDPAAITWRMHGGGKVVYVATNLHRVMGTGPGPAFTETERLIGELVRWLGGERIRIRAPREVTVSAYRAPRGATIHIVNKPPRGPYVHEQVHRSGPIEIVIPQSLYVADVTALDGSPVDWNHENDRLAITVHDVAEYRCLCVEGALG